MKFYTQHQQLGKWDPQKIQSAMADAMLAAGLHFQHWKKTCELYTVEGKKASQQLNWNPDVVGDKVTNGDMNITTDPEAFSDTAEHLFAASGRRGNIPKDKKLTIVNAAKPKMSDVQLSKLVPIFKGTILEDLHKSMEDKFSSPIRIRCQNRPVGSKPGAGLYWHKDDPVENRFHIPVWTNPGHVLLFSERDFEWQVGFNPAEINEPMDFVGHYVPADGSVYEFYTKNYMHAVASVGIGWYQDRGLQTRCHLSFWKATEIYKPGGY